MGRHSAADDAAVHPLVAAALAGRAADGDQRPSHSDSPGWPEPAPDEGGGLGWPGDIRPDSGAGRRGAEPAPPPAAPESRRRWRRLFGASPAA